MRDLRSKKIIKIGFAISHPISHIAHLLSTIRLGFELSLTITKGINGHEDLGSGL